MIGYHRGKRRTHGKICTIYGIKKGSIIFDAHFGLFPIGKVC